MIPGSRLGFPVALPLAACGAERNDETKRLEVEPEEAKTVRAMYAEFLQHRSLRRTVVTLNAAGKFSRGGKPWAGTSRELRVIRRHFIQLLIDFGSCVVYGLRVLRLA